MTWDELEARGRRSTTTRAASTRSIPTTAAILVYTSGTTGRPKGAMLSHAQPHWAAGRFREAFGTTRRRRGALLPAAVPRRRAAELGDQRPRHRLRRQLRRGRRVVRAGPARRAADAVRGVPRVWEKMLATVEIRMADASRLKRAAYRAAMRQGRRLAPKRMAGRLGPADRAAPRCAELVAFRSLRDKLGLARVRAAICGAAPIAPQVLEYFWALGVPVYEIYGQTENTAVCTLMPADDVRIGTVGRPLAGVELRIADDGEILTRSPAVFAGYFNDPEATAAAVDADGWLHTGDVGELDERRLPDDHRPQEGHHHHRGRQERLAVGDREPAEGLAVRARGDGGRRPPQVPRRADRDRARHGRRLGGAPRARVHHLRRPVAQGRGARADRRVGRGGQRASWRRRRRSSGSRCSRRSSTTRTAS